MGTCRCARMMIGEKLSLLSPVVFIIFCLLRKLQRQFLKPADSALRAAKLRQRGFCTSRKAIAHIMEDKAGGVYVTFMYIVSYLNQGLHDTAPRSTPICLLVDQSSDDIEEVSGDSTRLRIDNTVEDIEDGDIRDNKVENEGDDIEVEDAERKSRSIQRIGAKRKQPDSVTTNSTSKEEGPPTQRRKLRDVVAELVKIWDSPIRYFEDNNFWLSLFSDISDPLDTPELRRRKENRL